MLTQLDLALLSEIFLFKALNEEELCRFLNSEQVTLATFKKGDCVFGADEKRLGVLLSGKAVALPTEEGKGALKTFLPGELFGAASCFCEEGCSPLSNIAAKTACRVVFISREGVESLIKGSPEVALLYIRFLSGRVEFLNRRIGTFTSRETAVRFARYILKTADSDGLCKNINFSALATSLGISRASLYRAKSELTELNAISVEGRTITLLDTEALKNIK